MLSATRILDKPVIAEPEGQHGFDHRELPGGVPVVTGRAERERDADDSTTMPTAQIPATTSGKSRLSVSSMADIPAGPFFSRH